MVRRKMSVGVIVAIIIVVAAGVIAALYGIGFLKIHTRSDDIGNKMYVGYNEAAKYIVDVYETVCLRKEPFVNSEVLSYVERRQEVKILSGWGDNFVLVRAENGDTGYIFKDYISPEGELVKRANQEKIGTENESIYYVTAPSSIPVYNGFKGNKVEACVPIDFITNGTPVRIIKTMNDKVAEIVVLDSGVIGYVNTERISKDKKNADSFRQRIKLSDTGGKFEERAVVSLNSLDRVPVFSEADNTSRVQVALVPGSWLRVMSSKNGFCYVADAFDESRYLGYIENRFLYVN